MVSFSSPLAQLRTAYGTFSWLYLEQKWNLLQFLMLKSDCSFSELDPDPDSGFLGSKILQMKKKIQIFFWGYFCSLRSRFGSGPGWMHRPNWIRIQSGSKTLVLRNPVPLPKCAGFTVRKFCFCSTRQCGRRRESATCIWRQLSVPPFPPTSGRRSNFPGQPLSYLMVTGT